MEGRKAVGGKLEVKIRVRDPFVNKQVEEVKEKWLIVDQLERRPAPPVQVSILSSITTLPNHIRSIHYIIMGTFTITRCGQRCSG